MARMHRSVSNRDDVIDSRDIVARIEELQESRDDFQPNEDNGPTTWQEENEDDAEELRVLMALAEEASGSEDWGHGATLIRDSYFEQYAREFADDMGLLLDERRWPYTCIDWEMAARDLQADFMSVDFDGVEYWVQS